MATIRRVFDSHEVSADQGGIVTVACWYEYDSTTLNVTAAGCDNPGPGTAWIQAALAADGSRAKEVTIPPFTNRSVVVPTGAAQRLRLVVNAANGKLDGIDFLSSYSIG